MLIITPAWPGQLWFSRLLKIICKKPTTFTSTQGATVRSCRKVESTLNTEFTATSGLDNLRQNLLAEGISKGLPTLSQTIGEHLKSRITSHIGKSGVAGVLNGRYLPLDRI